MRCFYKNFRKNLRESVVFVIWNIKNRLINEYKPAASGVNAGYRIIGVYYFLNFSDSSVAPERVKPSQNSLWVFSRRSL